MKDSSLIPGKRNGAGEVGADHHLDRGDPLLVRTSPTWHGTFELSRQKNCVCGEPELVLFGVERELSNTYPCQPNKTHLLRCEGVNPL